MQSSAEAVPSGSGIAITILPPTDSVSSSDHYIFGGYRDTSPSTPSTSPTSPNMLDGTYRFDHDPSEYTRDDYSNSTNSSTQSLPSSLLKFDGISLGDSSAEYSFKNQYAFAQQQQSPTQDSFYGTPLDGQMNYLGPRLSIPPSPAESQYDDDVFTFVNFENFDGSQDDQPALQSPETYETNIQYANSEHVPSPTSAWSSLSPDSELIHSPAPGMPPSDMLLAVNTSSNGLFTGRPRGHSFGGVGNDILAPSIRGRAHIRNASSPSPSIRRHSPYSRSPVTPSSQLPTAVSDLLTVPQREFPGSDLVRRRHSFSQGRTQQSSSPTFCFHESSDAAQEYSQQPLRRVASMAGIKASEARRTKEAKFQCDLCFQSFTTNHNLKNHRNVHLGVKPFQCNKCRRSSTTQSVHTRHMKTCKAPEPSVSLQS